MMQAGGGAVVGYPTHQYSPAEWLATRSGTVSPSTSTTCTWRKVANDTSSSCTVNLVVELKGSQYSPVYELLQALGHTNTAVGASTEVGA